MPDPIVFSASPDSIWLRLVDAADASKPPLGLKSLTLATVGIDGSPQARTIILRAADPVARTVAFHADRTSAKITELRRDPRATLVGWDADARLQLRLTTTIDVHLDDADADAFWASQPASALDVYRVRPPAGSVVASADDVGRADAPQRERFALLVARVASIEWLWLGKPAQRRGRFSFAADGSTKSVLLTP